MHKASSFIETIQKHQGLQVACIEEIAYKNGWITKEQVAETAEILFEKNKLLFCGYLLQQSVEKILKAYYQKTSDIFPPRTHNLIYLAEKTKLIEKLNNEQEELLYKLNPLNLETRYPEYRAKISKTLTKEKVFEMLSQTKEFHKWIKQKL